jgi:hypothetical protein
MAQLVAPPCYDHCQAEAVMSRSALQPVSTVECMAAVQEPKYRSRVCLELPKAVLSLLQSNACLGRQASYKIQLFQRHRNVVSLTVLVWRLLREHCEPCSRPGQRHPW